MSKKAAALLDLVNDRPTFFVQTAHSPRSNGLRWGHSAVWALLALWLFQRTWMPDAGGMGSLLPLIAGLAYVTFIVTLITTSRRRTR
jgi:hypothetical protein